MLVLSRDVVMEEIVEMVVAVVEKEKEDVYIKKKWVTCE